MERKSSLKRFFIGVIALILCALMFSFIAPINVGSAEQVITVTEVSTTAPTEDPTTEKEAYIPSKIVEETIKANLVEITYIEPSTSNEAMHYAEKIETYISYIYSLLPPVHKTDLYVVGYKIAYPNISSAWNIYYQYQEDYKLLKQVEEEAARWDKRAQEYPVATRVWKFMKEEFGWSDIVCAGIMGNFMAECGGCWTSDLDWQLNETSGLGMVQWIGKRRTQIVKIYGKNPSIEEQLLFMKDELYGTNGVTKQVTDRQLNAIMQAETPEECAFAFAKYYERCASQHRAPRKNYARHAYEYFVD